MVPKAGLTDRARLARTRPRAYLAATVWRMDQSEDKPALSWRGRLRVFVVVGNKS